MNNTLERTGFFNFLNFLYPPSTVANAPSTQSVERPVNPKGHFANERTFLSWLQCNYKVRLMIVCLVLGSLAIGLLNFGDFVAQMSGIVFCTLAVFMMFYALIQYHIRLDKLKQRETGIQFEDSLGTWFMVVGVFIAVIVNFIFHYMPV